MDHPSQLPTPNSQPQNLRVSASPRFKAMSLTIKISDGVSARLGQVATTLRDRRGANRAAAEGALPVIQNQFRGLSSSNRNRFGVRGGFWNRMLAGTSARADAQQGVVRMPREVALRYFGGIVTPKKSKFLAIPARAEAYGKSPRQFNDLRFQPFAGKPGGMLVQRDQTRVSYGRARKDGSRKVTTDAAGGGVFFWLVPMAIIKADRNVLPTGAQLSEGALRGLETWFTVQTKGGPAQ